MELINFTLLSEMLINEIYKWRNVVNIRSNSFNKKRISIKEHKEFIKSLNDDLTKRYFLAFLEKEPVGVVSFTNINLESAYIGYYKNPFLKQKGIGQILLTTAINYATKTLQLQEVFMEVFISNKISQHCIVKQGFKEIWHDEKVIKYQLRLV